jgi:protein-S-isoprenylcysteine O-methyltransferase Ste14
MTPKPNRWGVGPKWALPTALCFVVALGAHILTYPRFLITRVSSATCLVVGALFVAAGVYVYVTALMSLRKGLRSGALVTHGLYGIMRHPLYASSILLIMPGVAFAFCSWLLLPVPVLAYVACRLVLPAEDDELLERYGQQFSQYRQRTNALYPTRPQPRRGRAAGRNGRD